MTVNIEIEPEENKPQAPGNIKFKLQARKALDGSIIISDHPEIDIVVDPDKMKIIAFAKSSMDDMVYAAQSRLFEFLFRKGIVAQESVKGGNVYSSLEGTILSSKEKLPIDEVAVFGIGKFIEEERPSFMYQQAIEKEEEERLFEPDTEDSTEFGEVPHSEKKGSIQPHNVRRYLQGF